jgi:hypothetical protein
MERSLQNYYATRIFPDLLNCAVKQQSVEDFSLLETEIQIKG